MIRSDGRSWESRYIYRYFFKLWFGLRGLLARDMEIVDGEHRYRFRCSSYREMSRCMTLFVKEEGTCNWIKDEVQPGDVFFDVGANIGIYTILAARRVGAEGRVFAFEPHGANFACLIDNIVINDLQDVVTPCSFALGPAPGFFPFNYVSNTPASSDSQLSTLHLSSEETYVPTISEFKYASAVDDLIAAGALVAPHHVKIDVDGNELLILRGMTNLLTGPDRPKTLQVEINMRAKDQLYAFMEDSGYAVDHKHYTRTGLKKIAAGGDPEAYAYNAVFRAA